MLIPLRKPRPFSGARGQSLKELYATCVGRGLGIIKVNPITNTDNKRYNTEAVIALSMNGDAVNSKQNTVYNRLDIKRVFKLAGFNTVNGDVAPVKNGAVYTHPMTTSQIIEFLNGMYRCDFDETDITVTHKGGSLYSIVAKDQSLGYVGEGDLTIGEGGTSTISCAGAPSFISIPLTMDMADEANVPAMEVTVDGEVVFSGSMVNTEMPDALLKKGIKISMESDEPTPPPAPPAA